MRYKIKRGITRDASFVVIDEDAPNEQCVVFSTDNQGKAIAKVQELCGLIPADGKMNTYAQQVAQFNQGRFGRAEPQPQQMQAQKPKN